jgi:hypothetical protein
MHDVRRFFNRQQTTKLNMAGASVRAQKAFALDYCAASFVTEGELHVMICGHHSCVYSMFLAYFLMKSFSTVALVRAVDGDAPTLANGTAKQLRTAEYAIRMPIDCRNHQWLPSVR